MILASHSRLTIPPETWYVLRLLENFDPTSALTASEAAAAAKLMVSHYRWPDMNIDAKDFEREVQDLKNPQLRDVVEIVYRTHLERDGKPRWGDKTPGYIRIVPELIAMFPDSKFIHFYRDGRDVARSFQVQGWYGRWLHENTREWNESLDYNARWRSSPLAHRVLQVRYEDLVLDTEKSLRDICHFLDEEYEPQMLSWQNHVEELVPAREAHIHGKLKNTPNREDVYRWKKEMSAREVLVSEAFMGRHLEEMGYERRYRGGLWPIALQLTRWYCRTVLPVAALPVRAARAVSDRLLGRSKLRPRNARS